MLAHSNVWLLYKLTQRPNCEYTRFASLLAPYGNTALFNVRDFSFVIVIFHKGTGCRSLRAHLVQLGPCAAIAYSVEVQAVSRKVALSIPDEAAVLPVVPNHISVL
jgi:hypothetical protein